MYSTYSTYCTVQLGRCLLVLSMAGPWHQRAQAQPSVKVYATVTVTEGGVFRKLSAERDICGLRRFVNSFLLQAFWTFDLFWMCLAGYVYP